MSFQIRDIKIKNNLVLAPMAGVTNEAFRIICKENNVGLVMAEMVSDKAIGFQNKRTLEMTKVNPVEHPISMQIFGGEVESLVSAAKYIDEYSDADIIDINMGCPVTKVAKKAKAGASLLIDSDNVYNIVKNVVDAVKKPVTVKIRLGWDSNSINCIENAKMIEKAGASAITIHARTRAQMYQGKADWSYIKAVKESVNIPVIGNGDIVTIYDAKRMLDETHCDAIAIARGALGNPFIFREIDAYLRDGTVLPKATTKEIFNTIIYHHKLLEDLKGPHLALLEMRSHISWYLKGLPGSAKIKDICNKENDFNNIITILKNYLSSI